MSHAHERTEKICLNCNAQLIGRYCHVCGQENINPRESIWSVITHFFNDITHFDGKFFKTVGILVRKPGFLPLEYINGRRASYLHPIRLYIFTSAVFFIVFYSAWNPDFAQVSINRGNDEDMPTPARVLVNSIDTVANGNNRQRAYKSVAEYDSLERTLPPNQRDGWLERKLAESFIKKSIKYGGSSEEMRRSIFENFLHSFPYLLFVSLPICAFFLQMLYARNKNNLYAGNTIFLVYVYVFTFLVLLVSILLLYLKRSFQLGWLEWLRIFLIFYIGYYTARAMKRYYGQGTGVTVIKFTIFGILAFFTIAVLFLIFLLLSALKV